MVDALDALPIPPVSFQFNNRKLIQGFYRGLGIPDVTAAIRTIDKLDKLPAEHVAELLVSDAGATPEQAQRCLELATIRVPDTSFVERVRALGVDDELLDEGLAELAAVVEGCAARTVRQVDGRGQPAHRARPRLLHRHRGRDLHGRLRAPEVGRRRRSVRRARERRRARPTRASASPSASPAPSIPLLADGVARPGADRCPAPCWSRSSTRSPAPPATPSPTRCGPAASRARWPRARRSSASRSGTPSGAASRSSGSPGPTAPRGQGHPQRGAGAGGPGDLDPAGRGPATADRQPADRQRGEPVIRTHDAGALRAEHVGQTVTLAGWVARRRDHGGVAFLDLREASGVVQVVVRDEDVAHSLRSEYCLKVTGEVAGAPEGNANPNLPTGEIEVIAARRRGAQRARRRCRSRSTSTSTSARRRGSSTATSTCAAPAPTPRSACAARSTRPPATCSTATTSSRSRRRR